MFHEAVMCRVIHSLKWKSEKSGPVVCLSRPIEFDASSFCIPPNIVSGKLFSLLHAVTLSTRFNRTIKFSDSTKRHFVISFIHRAAERYRKIH